MTIAELFVNLGVKGSDKAAKEVNNVKNSLGDVASSGLAAKAAIIGVMYGLERLMSQSGKTGTSLTQFASFTGLSAETLQRWQYAARQAGESSEELLGNVKSVQGAMTAMLTGHGAPEGMAMLANKVGFDPSKARDTFYVLNKLQEYANATKNTPDLANRVMASFGLTDGTIAAMRRNAFQAKTLSQAPIYSDRETQQLNKVDVAWSNLGHKIEMAMGHLTAKHGMELVKDVSTLADEVLRLADAFITLAEKLEVFKVFDTIFKGWTLIFKGINDTAKEQKETEKRFKQNPNAAEFQNTGVFKNQLDWFNKAVGIAPKQPQQTGNGQTNHVTQSLHFQHDGKDHARTGESVKKAVQGALRQMPAQNQGS
jgi:hypothetical protein